MKAHGVVLADKIVPDFIELPNWPLNPPDLNPMDYSIWGGSAAAGI